MQDRFLHPLTSSSLTNFFELISAYGCDLKYLPWLLYIGMTRAVRQPFVWLERWKYHNVVARQPIEPPPIFIVGHGRLQQRDPRVSHLSEEFGRWISENAAADPLDGQRPCVS